MNKSFLLSIIFSFSSLLIFGQNIETIISKHIEAHGGIENWKAISSMKITGKFTSFSETKDFQTIIAKPNLFYSEFGLGMYNVKEGMIGETSWTNNPWFDLNFARKTNSVEHNVILQKAEFSTPLFHYNEPGYKFEYKGKEELEGIEVFNIELTRPNGEVETWYLNSKTYLEHMSKSTWSDFANPTPQETFYSEFTKVGNVVIPFYIERVFSIRLRVTEIENVEFNIDIDKKLFNIPMSDEMHKLSFMEGDWNVKIDVLGRNGWSTADSTSSTIKYMDNFNILQENISYVRYFPISIINNWTYNSDSKKYRISTFNDFYSNMDIIEGSFFSDSIVYDNVNISFDSTDNSKRYRRGIVKDIKKDSFNVEVASSQDKGASWIVVQKLFYTRKQD